MARPKKNTVDYFPHSTHHKGTMFIIEQKYGNDGYAFWFKLLELLASTEGHYLDLNNRHKWEFLQAITHLGDDKCEEILELLSNLDAIDRELWQTRVVWSDNFMAGIADVYKNRRVEIPAKPSFYIQKPDPQGVSTYKSTQSKVKESKVNKTKVKETIMRDGFPYVEIISDFNQVTNSHYRIDPITKDLIDLINARMDEGFTFEDFKAVHRNMQNLWCNDPKMKKFIRPHTLYTAKFQSYLNVKIGLSDQGKISQLTEKNLNVFKNFVKGEDHAQ